MLSTLQVNTHQVSHQNHNEIQETPVPRKVQGTLTEAIVVQVLKKMGKKITFPWAGNEPVTFE